MNFLFSFFFFYFCFHSFSFTAFSHGRTVIEYIFDSAADTRIAFRSYCSAVLPVTATWTSIGLFSFDSLFWEFYNCLDCTRKSGLRHLPAKRVMNENLWKDLIKKTQPFPSGNAPSGLRWRAHSSLMNEFINGVKHCLLARTHVTGITINSMNEIIFQTNDFVDIFSTETSMQTVSIRLPRAHFQSAIQRFTHERLQISVFWRKSKQIDCETNGMSGCVRYWRQI